MGGHWPSLAARLLAMAAGFESGHLSKRQNGRNKQRSGQISLAHQKNIKKVSLYA
jgi:hypothetical protein